MKQATNKELMEVRRDLTVDMIAAMGAAASTKWPGTSWERISPVLDDMTIDPDVMGLLVFIGYDDHEARIHVSVYGHPTIRVELHGAVGWLVLTFAPDMIHDVDGRGRRMSWSERLCDWISVPGAQDAPAVRDPCGLVWGWSVVNVDQQLH